MNSQVSIKLLDKETGSVLASTSFNASGRTTYLGYSKKLATLIEPYLETETLFEVESNILLEDGSNVMHKLSSFKKKGGVVVQDAVPLDMSKGIFSLRGNVPFVWLELIDPTVGVYGSNKWYSLKACSTDSSLIDANYGRHGADPGSKFATHALKPFQYPIYMYYPKLIEKKVKGYEDHTDERVNLHDGQAQTATKVDTVTGIADTLVADLVKRLTDYADATIAQNYSVRAEQVNDKAIVEARKMIARLAKTKTVATFNKRRLELMHIIPRKMTVVSDYMVDSKTEFAQVIQDETDLLNVLETQVDTMKKQADSQKENILYRLGLEIYPARQEQIDKVKSMLSQDLQDKIVNVFRVINKKTKTRFNDYLKKQNGRQKVREFWHGSRNANWWNILCKGLLLNSGAPTTGSMFGEGLYFSPSPTKSWGYTSARGSYWANGSSSTAFMGVYATAHNNPVNVTSYSSSYGNLNAKSFEQDYPGHDCLYCHGGTGMLRNDEVIVYREEQATINFLVEFEA